MKLWYCCCLNLALSVELHGQDCIIINSYTYALVKRHKGGAQKSLSIYEEDINRCHLAHHYF